MGISVFNINFCDFILALTCPVNSENGFENTENINFCDFILALTCPVNSEIGFENTESHEVECTCVICVILPQ